MLSKILQLTVGSHDLSQAEKKNTVLNTSYLTDSYIVFTLKLESRQNKIEGTPILKLAMVKRL